MHEDDVDGPRSRLFQRNPCPLAQCKMAAGNHGSAGELLHQLIYRIRTEDALTPREGKLWAAQAVRCWRDELGMSDHQFGRAIETLIKKGLIEKRSWSISPHNPVRITHLTLTEKGMAVLPWNKGGKKMFEARGARFEKPKGQILDLSSPKDLRNRLPEGGCSKDLYESEERRTETRERDATPNPSDDSGREAESKAFEEEIQKLGEGAPAYLKGGLAELVAAISDRSDVPLNSFYGTSKAAYEELLAGMRARAFSTFRKTGKIPMLPEEALLKAVCRWWEFREACMSDRDNWPRDFSPQFARHKAATMYDFVVRQPNPPQDPFMEQLQAHAQLQSKVREPSTPGG